MNDITYLYESEKGRINDFTTVLHLFTRCKNLDEIYTDYDISVPRNIRTAYSRLREFMKNDIPLIRLFFHAGESGVTFFANLLAESLVYGESVEEVINAFNDIDTDELQIRMLNFYDSKNNFPDSFYQFLIENKKLLMVFLDGINLDADLKWNMLSLIESPEGTKRKMVKLLTDFARELEIEYDNHRKLIDEYYETVGKRFEAYGDSRLMKMSDNYASLVKSGRFTTVRLAVGFFIPFSIQYKMYKRLLNVYLGFDYDKGLQVVQDIHEDEITFFKAFTDETRISIIKTIKDGELFASEIAERLGLPLSSLSHHLDILYQSGLVERRNEGKRSYYKIRPDSINIALRQLKKIIH
jgi:ArsR family transcriptional regulator